MDQVFLHGNFYFHIGAELVQLNFGGGVGVANLSILVLKIYSTRIFFSCLNPFFHVLTRKQEAQNSAFSTPWVAEPSNTRTYIVCFP
jgi:hypothetical protein